MELKNTMKNKKLIELENDIKNNLECELKQSATNLVFGKGNIDAEIFFIGEAPGKQEDIQGIPFVGSSGKRLDYLLSLVNLSIKDVYIANILKYRPPDNRDPLPSEIKSHTPYLVKQIEIIKPKIICTLGNFSTKFVLSNFNVDGMSNIEGISKLHGEIIELKINGINYKVLPLYHPAISLYKSSILPTLEKDIKKINDLLI